VDGEVDAEADEEHGKGDGDDVQTAHGDGSKACRPDQAHEQRQGRRQHQGPGTERHEEHDQDQDERGQARPAHVPGQAEHLLVVEGRVARDPDFDPALGFQTELLHGGVDGAPGGSRGQQGVEVEDGLRHDQASGLRLEARALEQETLPGDAHRVLVVDGHRGRSHPVHELWPGLTEGRVVAHAFQAHLHQTRQSGHAGIPGQLGQEGLDGSQPVHELLELGDTAEQEPLALEEGTRARNEDVGEVLGIPREPFGQRGGGLAHGFGALAVDHDQEGIVQGRKTRCELSPDLLELEVIGDELLVIGVHAEARQGHDREEGRERAEEEEHATPLGADEADPTLGGQARAIVDPCVHAPPAPRRGMG
jgi:hypothetical protein